MTIRRRALPLLALAARQLRPRCADTIDLALNCDTTLAPALRKVAAAYKARSGVRVFVFPTGPGLILPQLVRDIQNDIVVTQTTILEQAAQAGVIASAVRAQWRNPLVIAGLHGTATIDGTFAATDPSPASDIDGPALLARLGIKPTRDTRRRRYRRGRVPADHGRGAGRTAAHDRCPRRRTACGHSPGAAPRCNRRCSMRHRSRGWRGGQIPKASSPSSPAKEATDMLAAAGLEATA